MNKGSKRCLASLLGGALALAQAAGLAASGINRPQPVENIGGEVRAPLSPQAAGISLTATQKIGLTATGVVRTQPVGNLGGEPSAAAELQAVAAEVVPDIQAATVGLGSDGQAALAQDQEGGGQENGGTRIRKARKTFARVASSPAVQQIQGEGSGQQGGRVAGLRTLYDLGALPEPDPIRLEVDAQARALRQWGASPRKTQVIASSFSIDPKVVGRFVPDPKPYETRDLARILEAEDPDLRIVYVVSGKLDPAAVQHVLRGRADAEAIRSRVDFVELADDGAEPLAQKLLKPAHRDQLERIRRLVQDGDAPAALLTYMSGPAEWEVARALDIPLYGFHPVRTPDSGKSGNRRIFRAVGLPVPDGFEDVSSQEDLVDKIELLWRRKKDSIKSIVINLNHGASGLGLARLELPSWRGSRKLRKQAIQEALPGMAFPVGKDWDSFLELIQEQGAVVEEFLESSEGEVFSPSGQGEILPDKAVRVWSTHRQRLHGLEYSGAVFPASASLRREIVKMTREVGARLAALDIFGPFSVDYLAVPQRTEKGVRYKLYALEINVRWSATDHPRVAAQRLTGARHDRREAVLRYPDTGRLVYYNTSHKEAPGLKGIRLKDFLDFFEGRGVLFDPAAGEGVQFYFSDGIPAGKIGYVAIGRSQARANKIEKRLIGLIDALEREFRRSASGAR